MVKRDDSSGEHGDTDAAFLISDLGVGGAQRVLVNLVNQLAHEGYKLAVITLDSADTDYFDIDGSVRRIGLGVQAPSGNVFKATKKNMERVFAIRRAIIESAAPSFVGFVGRINVLLVLASVSLGKTVVISERNDPSRESLGAIWDMLRWLLYRRADVVTANSQGALKSMSSYVPEEKLRLVPNVSIQVEDSAVCVKRKKWILAVGRLEHQKGYDVLLQAFSGLSQKVDDWRLVIIGEGSQRDNLERLSHQLGIQKRVEWKGTTNPYRFYRQASIFVLPSRFEGMPNAMLEAMECGIPVVVSDASLGPLEYIENKETGIVVPVDDPVKLTQVLGELVSNNALRKRLGDAGKKRVDMGTGKPAIAVWKELLKLDLTNPDTRVRTASPNKQ